MPAVLFALQMVWHAVKASSKGSSYMQCLLSVATRRMMSQEMNVAVVHEVSDVETECLSAYHGVKSHLAFLKL